MAVVFVACAVFIAVVGVSLGGALLNPANGSSVTTRFAEWTRNHGGSGLANWIENEYYTHHQPKVGGRPAQRCHQGRGQDHDDAGPQRAASPSRAGTHGPLGQPGRGR